MSKIKRVLSKLEPDLKRVDVTILEFAVGKSPLIAEISNHLISSGGKRIRPILLILAAKLCGSKDESANHNLAAAVELIHSATLLHDDVVDDSDVRRGKKTANAIWDNKATILVGDYLFSIAFQLMVRSKNLDILDILAKASSVMADGEVMQLENSNNIHLTEKDYLEIIFGKTAVLFEAACQSGALISDASSQEVTALRDFGKNLGIIFQIVDDLLDYSANEKVLGKDIGNDFFEGKVTLPIIFTYSKASDLDKKLISDMFETNLLNTDQDWKEQESNLNKMLDVMHQYKAFELSKELALKYRDKARKNLDIFPKSDFKDDLNVILDYSLERIF